MATLLEPPKIRTRLSLTPLIDVVFLLLLFFMLATQFEKYQSIDLIFPSSNSELKPSNLKPILIHLLTNEKITVNGVQIATEIPLDQLLNSINKNKQTGVVLKIDEKVPTRRLTEIIDGLKTHKISPVTIID